GGPLSDKQAVRHKLAEMATDIEAGRWLTYAAWQKYAAGEDAVREVSMAKLFTAEMVNRVAYGCVQLHGGYGYMREYPVERFARAAAGAPSRGRSRARARGWRWPTSTPTARDGWRRTSRPPAASPWPSPSTSPTPPPSTRRSTASSPTGAGCTCS